MSVGTSAANDTSAPVRGWVNANSAANNGTTTARAYGATTYPAGAHRTFGSGADEIDADLAALGEARAKARRARAAFAEFDGATQEDLDRIVAAMAAAASSAAAELARLAVDETGYGVYEDKILKNLFNAEFVADSMKGMRTRRVMCDSAIGS